MWQIELFEQKDEKSAKQTSIDVRPGQSTEIRSGTGPILASAVAVESKPPQLVLILTRRGGVKCNGKALSLPLVILNESRSQLSIKQSGRRFALNITHSPGLSGAKPRPEDHCSLCHDPLESGKLSHCPFCGFWFHRECLFPAGSDRKCPLCHRGRPTPSPADAGGASQSDLSCKQSQTDLVANLVRRPGPTALLVGCGNIGSKLAVQLPLVGIRRVILIDPDRIDSSRNSQTCSIFTASELNGRLKVEVISQELKERFPRCEVVCFANHLAQIDPAALAGFCPLLIIGAVDNRGTRLQLAKLAQQLDGPLVDLAISGSPDQLVARVRCAWESINGISPLSMWSAADLQLLEQDNSCGRRQGCGKRPVSSVISGILAACLGLQQVQKLLAGDFSDVGFEIRQDLTNRSLSRFRLSPSPPAFPKSPIPASGDLLKLFRNRRRSRIQHDLEALQALAKAAPWLNTVVRPNPNVLLLKFIETPGLLQTAAGTQVWHRWGAAVLLPDGYPVLPPVVLLSPEGTDGKPFHPNIEPRKPFRVCYGQHLPDVLLDELPRRLYRLITLTPGAVLPNERDSLNAIACKFVRRLARENKVPLSNNTHLTPVTANSSVRR
jgi:hypothetical protein